MDLQKKIRRKDGNFGLWRTLLWTHWSANCWSTIHSIAMNTRNTWQRIRRTQCCIRCTSFLHLSSSKETKEAESKLGKDHYKTMIGFFDYISAIEFTSTSRDVATAMHVKHHRKTFRSVRRDYSRNIYAVRKDETTSIDCDETNFRYRQSSDWGAVFALRIFLETVPGRNGSSGFAASPPWKHAFGWVVVSRTPETGFGGTGAVHRNAPACVWPQIISEINCGRRRPYLPRGGSANGIPRNVLISVDVLKNPWYCANPRSTMGGATSVVVLAAQLATTTSKRYVMNLNIRVWTKSSQRWLDIVKRWGLTDS